MKFSSAVQQSASGLAGRQRHERYLVGAMAADPHLIATKFAWTALYAPAQRHQRLIHFRQQSKTDGLPLPYPFPVSPRCIDSLKLT